MGIFRDLIQQSEIDEQKEKAASIEQRVLNLEEKLKKTRLLSTKTLHFLGEKLQKILMLIEN
jgi:hypothetical protein